MEIRTLNQTNLTVSRVALGTMTFGAQVDEAAAGSLVNCFLDQGLNFIDTANVYNGGEAEKIVGKVLQGRRDRVVLATKVGIKMGEAPDLGGLSRSAIVKGIEDSLMRLRTDYVDLYYLHQPDYDVPLEESLEAADHLVRAGKVRFLGASNYAGWQVCQMLSLAEKKNWQPVRVAQPLYNLIARGIEQEFLPMCREFGLATIAYKQVSALSFASPGNKASPAANLTPSRTAWPPGRRRRFWSSVTTRSFTNGMPPGILRPRRITRRRWPKRSSEDSRLAWP